MVWPKGVPLPGMARPLNTIENTVTLDGDITLARGALIPVGTNVKLVGDVDSIQLRPEVAGRQVQSLGHCTDAGRGLAVVVVASGCWGVDTEAADSRLLQPHPSTAHCAWPTATTACLPKSCHLKACWSERLRGQ